MIRINQIKLPIDHKEAAFEKKIKKALHNTEYKTIQDRKTIHRCKEKRRIILCICSRCDIKQESGREIPEKE